MPQLSIEVHRVVSTPFEENSYIARLEGGSDCVVIDPGLEPERILHELTLLSLVPSAILITHGHSDHIAGNEALKRRWPKCPIICGRGDAGKLTNSVLNLSAAFGMPIISPPADILVGDGETFSAAGIQFKVLTIPGHSAGHVVYLCADHAPPLAFVGDVIFAGSIGRTDFPDGNLEQLLSGIRQKLFTLPGETLLLSGHGPTSTVAQERRDNPFCGERAGTRTEF